MVNPHQIEKITEENARANRKADKKADGFFRKHGNVLKERGLHRNSTIVGHSTLLHVCRGDISLTRCVLDGHHLKKTSGVFSSTGREPTALYCCSNIDCEINQAGVVYYLNLNARDKRKWEITRRKDIYGNLTQQPLLD